MVGTERKMLKTCHSRLPENAFPRGNRNVSQKFINNERHFG